MLRQQLTEQEKLMQKNNDSNHNEHHHQTINDTSKRQAQGGSTKITYGSVEEGIESSSSNHDTGNAINTNIRNPSHHSDDDEQEDLSIDDEEDDDDDDEDDDDDSENLSGSWEVNDDDESSNEDDDDDEETSLLLSDQESTTTSTASGTHNQSCRCCCCPSGQNKRKRKRSKTTRMTKTFQMLKPILSPLVKVYAVAKEAVILVTNVDNVWDSPALDTAVGMPNSSGVPSRSNGGDYRMYHDAMSPINHPSDGAIPTFTSYDNNTGGGGFRREDSTTTVPQRVSFNHKLGVLFWFVVFALAFATERGSFKVLVDRMGPFRMVVGAEGITAVHALISGFWLLLRWIFRGSGDDNNGGSGGRKGKMVMLPLAEVGLMAILDTMQLLLAVISGSHVAPILTAVLVHFTIPLTTIFTQCVHPDGICKRREQTNQNNNNTQQRPSVEDPLEQSATISDNGTIGGMTSQQIFGATLILLSTVLAQSPAVLTLVYPNYFPAKTVMANRTAWNTILFVLSCVPGAASQLYKEHAMTNFAQPVNSTFLNFIISAFSCIFAFIVSPLFYSLQGLADTPVALESGDLKVEWWIHLYPSTQISKNFVDSLQCFTGTLSNDVQIGGYPEQAHCDFAYGIVVLHVFSIIVINHAVERICNAGAFKIMHRGISAGIILSVISMMYYQIFIDDIDYGFFPSSWHITCGAVLVMGSEVFHRASFEVPSFETTYPEVGGLYYDSE